MAQPAPAVVASNAQPAATAAKEQPAIATQCRNSSVFGRVISQTAIMMQGFTCFADANSDGSSVGARDIALGGCPLASTTAAHKSGCEWDVTLNVRLADPGDAGKMRVGQLVRLGGDFALVQRDQKQYLAVANAKVLFRDAFYGRTGGDIAPFYNGVSNIGGGGNSASGDPFGTIHGIGN